MMFFYNCQKWLYVCIIVHRPLFLRGLPIIPVILSKASGSKWIPVQSWEEGFVP